MRRKAPIPKPFAVTPQRCQDEAVALAVAKETKALERPARDQVVRGRHRDLEQEDRNKRDRQSTEERNPIP